MFKNMDDKEVVEKEPAGDSDSIVDVIQGNLDKLAKVMESGDFSAEDRAKVSLVKSQMNDLISELSEQEPGEVSKKPMKGAMPFNSGKGKIEQAL
jgi:hypothetical protein